MFINILILLLSITISSLAHVFLKKGVMSLGGSIHQEIDGFWEYFNALSTNPWMLGGVSLHVGALVVWVWALSRVDVSFAYPFLALGYVLVSLLAWVWLGENLSQSRLAGIVI